MSLQVAAFYRFAPLAEAHLAELRQRLLAVGSAGDVKGTVLLAPEGVNGTVSGPEAGVEELLELLQQADPGLKSLEVKRHCTKDQAFHRLKVRLKREIVTIGRAEVDPTAAVGAYVDPQDWNALISDPRTLVIDTRNIYEVAVGTFAGSVHPGTSSFREFPAWVERQLRPLVEAQRPRALALFCTGGIRCEKATAHLIEEGFEGVHHLQGGILRYLEAVDPAESRWQGDCFVFDQRVAVNHRLERGDHSLCHGCRMPLSPADRALPSYCEGVSCRHCIPRLAPEDRERFSERQRQVDLARRRGEAHIGREFPPGHPPQPSHG
ncbi:MAG: rhodanese-related sulfurtransferase [Cyanobacteria bacterium]|nr:rhodanese-related sulfurtransferase [Cyanobacteriota bacterium]